MSAALTWQGTQLTNPVHSLGMADPFLFTFNGIYYAIGTGGAPDGRIFPVLTSPDLVDWTFAGGAMDPLPDADPGLCWAPEVIYRNGLFYLYYAACAAGADHHLRVATSGHPAGPYLDSGVDLTGRRHPWAIDAHPFRDDDGTEYLFYTVEMKHGDRVGVGNVVDRFRDPFTLAGEPRLVTPPCAEWQEYERARAEKGGLDWFTVEGPCTVKRAGRYYQMYSGGNYSRPNYAVGYASASHPEGPWTPWTAPGGIEPGRLLETRSAVLYGPGHHSVAPGLNNVDRYICYHAWEPDRKGRRMCLDRLEFHGDRLYVDGPNPGRHGRPRQPWLREAGPFWLEADRTCETPLPREALIEINLRHTEGEGRLGLRLGGPGTEIAIDYGAHKVVAGGSCFWLPAGFAPHAYHQLLLQADGPRVQVRLDGVLLGDATLPRGDGEGPWALLADGAAGEYAGLTVTAHLEDLRTVKWEYRGSGGPDVLLQGQPLTDYEAQVDLSLQVGSAAGLCAWQSASGFRAMAILLPRQGAWYLASGVGTLESAGYGGAGDQWQLDPLPALFDPAETHSLRAVKTGAELEVFLDGQFCRVLDLPVSPSDEEGAAGPAIYAGLATLVGFRRTGFNRFGRDTL